MTLSMFLKSEKMTQMSFAKQGKFSPHTVAKWVQGQRIPRHQDMLVISRLTDGKVMPNDFYKQQWKKDDVDLLLEK